MTNEKHIQADKVRAEIKDLEQSLGHAKADTDLTVAKYYNLPISEGLRAKIAGLVIEDITKRLQAAQNLYDAL